MPKCPKCGKDATEAVLKRQGHCSRCQDEVDDLIYKRDRYAEIILRTDLANAEIIDETAFADYVWKLATAMATRRPKGPVEG